MTKRRKPAGRKATTKRAPTSTTKVARRAAPRSKAKRPGQGRAAARRGGPRRTTKGAARAEPAGTRGRGGAKGRPKTLVAGLDRPAVDLAEPTPPAKLAAARRRRTMERKAEERMAEEQQNPPQRKGKAKGKPRSFGHHSARFAGVRNPAK